MHVLDLKEVEVRVDLVERLAGGEEFQQLLSAEPVATNARLPAELSGLHGQPVEAGNGVRHGTESTRPCSLGSRHAPCFGLRYLRR